MFSPPPPRRDSAHAEDRDHDGRWSRERRSSRQSNANGRYPDRDRSGDDYRSDRSDKDYRSSRERLTDSHDLAAEGHMERRGSNRAHRERERSSAGSGVEGHRGSIRERGGERERRSPGGSSDHSERYNKEGGELVVGGEGGVGGRNSHRILIEHASDTQPAAEDLTDMQRMRDRRHLDPNSARTLGSGGSRSASRSKKMESMLRNDSLSSDPSDCVRPPPPKPHKHRRSKKQRQHSLSSSDDDVRSTPECSSCEEQDLESESVSEKGGQLTHVHFPAVCLSASFSVNVYLTHVHFPAVCLSASFRVNVYLTHVHFPAVCLSASFRVNVCNLAQLQIDAVW
jgi:regulating synaptic membrane exocytosis protein 2